MIAPECLTHRAPPLFGTIRNPVLFKKLAAELQKHVSPSSPMVIVAGRGTTGTREVATVLEKGGRRVVHFVRCFSCSGNATRANLKFVHGVHTYLVDRRIGGRLAHEPLIASESLATALVDTMKVLLAEGVTAFTDTPWVNFFTELFYATCPHVRVVLTTRDSVSWARSRKQNHAHSSAFFLCPRAFDHDIADPFSITQCAARNTKQAAKNTFGNGSALDASDVSDENLSRAFDKYQDYVQRIVPAELLLNVNYFSSRVLISDAMSSGQLQRRGASAGQPQRRGAREEWTALQAQTISMFSRGS